MKTNLFLSTLLVGVPSVTSKSRPFGTPKTLVGIVTTIPRGGQRGYEYHDYEDAYKNPSQEPYAASSVPTNPDYNEDYYGRRRDVEDPGFDEDRGYYDDRGTSLVSRY